MYIGNSPANCGNYQIVDDIASSFNGTATAFALTAGNKHIPTGGATNQYLKYSASGTVLDKESRNYYLPNTLKVMTKESIQQRNLTLVHGDAEPSIEELTAAHIEAEAWWSSNT